ncbi:hypothetical protein NMG60_11031346, partial [Bertholletia excelsa]
MTKPGTGAGDMGGSGQEPNAHKKKSNEAARKHAVAERRRRWRIKGHMETLRQLLIENVSTSRTVKATILTEAVRQVKELKRAADAALREVGEDRHVSSGEGSPAFMFPGEADEAAVSYCNISGRKAAKATVCCEDWPGLNRDLTEAIRSVGATAVRAEMATVGGRTRAEVVVEWRAGGGGEEDVGSLRRALKALVEC